MISINAVGRLVVQVPFVGGNLEKLRKVPAEKQWEGRTLVTICCNETLLYLQDAFPETDWTPEAAARLQAAQEAREAFEKAKESRKQLVLDGDWVFSGRPPFAHQKTIFYLSRDLEHFAVFAEQGTGKSRTMVDTTAYLYQESKIDSVLIIAPNGVHRNWVGEFEAYFRPDIQYAIEYYDASGLVAHKKRVEDLIKVRDRLAIFCMNVESISHDSGMKIVNRFLKKRKTLVIIDESQKIKSPSSSRGKNAIKIGEKAAFRRLLTGTPVTNGLEDLFNQFRFLNPTILGCDTFTEFKAQYCVLGKFQHREIIGYKNVDQLQERITPWSFHVAKKDCLDLPDKVYVKRPVDLTAEQKRLYKELKDQFVAVLDSGETITAQLALTRLLRLHQVVCGHYAPDATEEIRKGTWYPLANNRMSACLDIVEEARSKVIVWSRFIPDILQLQELFKKSGIGVVTYCGLNSAEEAAANLKSFKTDPGIKVFLGTQMKGGTGLTINEAKTTIYYSNSFSLEDRLQSEDRNHRAGQDESVTYYDLYTPGTVDSKILYALKKKQEVANLVKSIEGIRAMLSEGDEIAGSLFD